MRFRNRATKLRAIVYFGAFLLLQLVGGINVFHARTPKELFQNGDLTNANNYSPAGIVTSANDLLLSTSTTALTLNGTTLSAGSINQTNNLAYTLSNNAPGTANSTITIGVSGTNSTPGASPQDIIYLGGATSSLTLQGPNGGDGIGVLGVSFGNVSAGNLNVALAGATLTLSANASLPSPGSVTKSGAGTLNVNGAFSGTGSQFIVNGGTVNVMSGGSFGGYVVLTVDTGSASNTVVNLFHSVGFRGLSGGTDTAEVNLIGAATQLSLSIGGGQGSLSYRGRITGQGSVSFDGFTTGHSETFTGNNSYTGTTTVTEGTLIIDGSTSGQGSYAVSRSSATVECILTGSGSIGLKPDAKITVGVNGSTLAPGRISTVGTLTVGASGTGGVVLGNGSVLAIDLGAGGVSDQLKIVGGSIDLTSSSDTLQLTPLANAFDGLDYTIATFAQNVNGGVFNNVQGLPFNYQVQYNPTNIRVVAAMLPLQFTSVYSRKTHGTAGTFDIDLLVGEPVECRSSGGNHTLVFNFTNYMVSGNASVSSGIGSVAGKPIFFGKSMIVNLENVADAQLLSVTLHGATDRFSQVMPDTVITIGFLEGDTNGNKVVNSSDIVQVKAASGFVTNASNFREDLNLNGVISASDLGLVKARSGAFIPP